MSSRRTVLAGFCSVVGAGCFRRSDAGSGSTNDGESDSSDADDSRDDDSTAAVAEPTETVLQRKTIRGRADPISAQEAEWDRWVEYLDEAGEVRYVSAYGPAEDVDPDDYDGDPPDRDLTFDTTSWDRWKHIRADDVAGKAAADEVADQLGRDDVGRAIDVASDPRDRRTVVLVIDIVDDDGNVEEGTATDSAELADATPKSVAVTYELDERTFETTRDVYARYEKKRID